MKKKIGLFIFLLANLRRSISVFILCNVFQLCAQHPGWTNFTNGNWVTSIATRGNYVWVGTRYGGLVRIDRTEGTSTFNNHANSGLPDNRVHCVAIDSAGCVWVGTGSGCVRFDGTKWTTFSRSDSSFPGDYVMISLLTVTETFGRL